MNQTRTLPFFVAYIQPSPAENLGQAKSLTFRVKEFLFASAEVISLVVANIFTVLSINLSEAVRNEYGLLFKYFFGRIVEVIPTDAATQPEEEMHKKVDTVNVKKQINPFDPANSAPIGEIVPSVVPPLDAPANVPLQPMPQPEPLVAPAEHQDPAVEVEMGQSTIHQDQLAVQVDLPALEDQLENSVDQPEMPGEIAPPVNLQNQLARSVEVVAPPVKALRNQNIDRAQGINRTNNPVKRGRLANDGIAYDQNCLTSKELSVQIRRIQLALKNESVEGTAFLRGLNVKLQEQVKIARQAAVELHPQFLNEYTKENCPEEAKPTFDSATGNVCASIFQNKEAFRLMKEKFPALTTLAYTEELKIEIAGIIRIILCGEEALNAQPASSACCFQLRELQEKSSPPIEACGDIRGSQYLLDLLEEQSEEADLTKALCTVFQSCLSQKQTREELLAAADGYLQFLQQNPSQVAGIIQDYQSALLSPLPSKLGKIDSGNKSLPDLKEILLMSITQAQAAANAAHNPALQESFNQILKIVDVDLSCLAGLDLQSCGQEDFQKLVRIKLVEMVLMLSPFNTAPVTDALEEVLRANEFSFLQRKTVAFSPKFSDDFNSMSFNLENQIFLRSESFLAEGIQEYFSKKVVIANIVSDDHTTNFNTTYSVPPKKITTMRSLTVSWQISSATVDYLASQIDPQASQSSPERRFVSLQAEMLKNIDQLKEIAIPGLTQSYAAQLVNLLPLNIWWGAEQKEESSLLEINQIVEHFKHIFTSYHEFIRLAGLSRQPEGKVMPMIKDFTAALSAARQALNERQKTAAAVRDVDTLNLLSKDIEAILSRLPSETTTEASFFTRISNGIYQSNQAKEISWKVLRYEKQILDLKQLFESTLTHLPSLEEVLSMTTAIAENRDKDFVGILYQQLSAISQKIHDNQENDSEARFTQMYLEVLRTSFEKFLINFRRAFNHELKTNAKSENLKALQTICFLLYTGIDLSQEMKNTLELFNEIGANALGEHPETFDYKAGHPLHRHVQDIHTLQKRLTAAPYSSKAPLVNQLANSTRGQLNRDFDPNRQSNPTHKLYSLEVTLPDRAKKNILMLGMGTPTCEDMQSKLTLAPEFVGFIQSYKSTGKKHLYINNQNFLPNPNDWSNPKAWLAYVINGEETNRCCALMNAQNRDDMKGALFAMTLSKNTDFYKQSAGFKNANNAQQFKDCLIEKVFTSTLSDGSGRDAVTTGCYISTEIMELYAQNTDQRLDMRAREIAKAIHVELFEERAELTREERRIFIELFYSHLTKEILLKGGFDSMNTSCKDQIDRAAASNAGAYAEHAIVASESEGLLPHDVKMIQKLLLVRALFVRKRPILAERFEGFCDVYQYLLTNPQKIKSLNQKLFPGFTLIPS